MVVLAVIIVGSNYVLSQPSPTTPEEKYDFTNIKEIKQEPASYLNRTVNIHGELVERETRTGRTTVFLKQKNKHLELSGCRFNSTTTRVGVEGTVDQYQSCECIYRDPYLGWSDRSIRMKEQNSCRRSIPDMYNNSRCVEGSVKTHYYLTCGDVLYTE